MIADLILKVAGMTNDDVDEIKGVLADAERFQWLIRRGVAWRGCYQGDWKPGEWLYDIQNARKELDNFIARKRKKK